MLDRDLAALYGVETKNLNKAVRRNLDRFPADFMFQLTLDEAEACAPSRFQFGTLKRGHNIKYLPQVFTQEGVAMLSSVLRSPRAVQVNIAIMRVFVRLRGTLALHKELAHKLAERRLTGPEAARSFWKAPLPDLHRAARCLCLPALSAWRRTGWPPGQPRCPPAAGLSWGQDGAEPDVVVAVRRVVVVAVRRPAVVRVVVPTAAAIHTVRAFWPPPQIVAGYAAETPRSPPALQRPAAPAPAAAKPVRSNPHA